jgi:gamma-glutamyl-gamma-aminobutyrate hydrolase PuuD
MTNTPPMIGITAHESLVDDGAGVASRHHLTNVAYAKAVRKAGGIPVLLPMVDPADAALFASRVDAVLVTGGADVNPDRYNAAPAPETDAADPARDDSDIALIRAVIDDDRPLLCICRGIQILNVAVGGTLDQHHEGHFDLDRYNEDAHGVRVDAGTTLAKLLGATQIGVNSLHHQALDMVGPGLRPVAYSDDGLVEGVEVDGCSFALGVQWHPELLRHRPEHLALFRALVVAGASNGA